MREIVKRETMGGSVGRGRRGSALVLPQPHARVNAGCAGWMGACGRWGESASLTLYRHERAAVGATGMVDQVVGVRWAWWGLAFEDDLCHTNRQPLPGPRVLDKMTLIDPS